MNNQPDKRQLRGLAIASVGSSIKRINKLHYRVRSQSVETKWYNVEKQYGHNIGSHVDGEWICECPDFQNRHTVCKHIYAVSLSKELRRKIVSQDVAPIVATPITRIENLIIPLGVVKKTLTISVSYYHLNKYQ